MGTTAGGLERVPEVLACATAGPRRAVHGPAPVRASGGGCTGLVKELPMWRTSALQRRVNVPEIPVSAGVLCPIMWSSVLKRSALWQKPRHEQIDNLEGARALPSRNRGTALGGTTRAHTCIAFPASVTYWCQCSADQ